ncbi:MAG: hypothetical protein M3024_02055 [Candidatus Dormibacteraeota bacterium]|nr:hypothetical protein [Candidatus Dormibacteraeota bacterium]
MNERPEFDQMVEAAQSRSLMERLELLQTSVRVAAASGDWRAALAAVKLGYARLDRQLPQLDESEDADDVEGDIAPSKVAQVIRILRRLDDEHGDPRA